MESKNSISIKRSIAIKAIVTPIWKEDAEKELSKAISNIDQQLSQLEQEGQQIVNNIRSQSVNPLDPRVQEQVSQVQQQVAAKRNEIEEQKRNLLQQQSQVRELKMDEIVDQGKWIVSVMSLWETILLKKCKSRLLIKMELINL